MSRRLDKLGAYAATAAGLGMTVGIGLAHWLRWHVARRPLG